MFVTINVLGNDDDSNYAGHYSTSNDDGNDHLGYTNDESTSGEAEHYAEEGSEDDDY